LRKLEILFGFYGLIVWGFCISKFHFLYVVLVQIIQGLLIQQHRFAANNYFSKT